MRRESGRRSPRGGTSYSMNSSSGRLATLPAIRLACEWKCPLIRPGMASKPLASITIGPASGGISSGPNATIAMGWRRCRGDVIPQVDTMKLRSHGRYDFNAIASRPAGTWPNGARLAFYVALNLEQYAFGEGLVEDLVPPLGQPDVMNYS